MLLVLLGARSAAGQPGRAALAIVSPPDGTVVKPGETLTVLVASPANVKFASVIIAGEVIGIAGMATSLPARFAVTIPADAQCGKQPLNAMARTASGQETITSVDIDIERPDMPASIASALRQFIFSMEGENNSLDLTARFRDGTVLRVQDSSKVSYRSTDENVASVDAHGYVTAIGEGEAEIIATYGPQPGGLSLSIPVAVDESIFTISTRNLDFGSLAIGTRSARRITITNHSVRTVKIKAIHTGGDFSETNTCVSAAGMAPSASCEVTATFQPSVTGIRIGAIGIDTDVHLIPVVLNLTGTGSKP
jgi:hypothetical protein